ncbi:MAG: hypothetical protein L0287_36090, partial [Anaerolineae bacterium]|nr:hypothetical protein [Anaerolineae bacterium]
NVIAAIQRMKKGSRKLAYFGQKANKTSSLVFSETQQTEDGGFAPLFTGTLANLQLSAKDPLDAIMGFKKLIKFEAQALGGHLDAKSGKQELILVERVVSLVRKASLLSWVVGLTRVKYESRPHAISTKAEVVVAFEAEIDITTEPDEVDALQNVEEATVDYLSKTANDLPTVIKLTLQRPLPAVVIAYRLYENVRKVESLVLRNDAEHPLFMPLEIDALSPRAPDL